MHEVAMPPQLEQQATYLVSEPEMARELVDTQTFSLSGKPLQYWAAVKLWVFEHRVTVPSITWLHPIVARAARGTFVIVDVGEIKALVVYRRKHSIRGRRNTSIANIRAVVRRDFGQDGETNRAVTNVSSI